MHQHHFLCENLQYRYRFTTTPTLPSQFLQRSKVDGLERTGSVGEAAPSPAGGTGAGGAGGTGNSSGVSPDSFEASRHVAGGGSRVGGRLMSMDPLTTEWTELWTNLKNMGWTPGPDGSFVMPELGLPYDRVDTTSPVDMRPKTEHVEPLSFSSADAVRQYLSKYPAVIGSWEEELWPLLAERGWTTKDMMGRKKVIVPPKDKWHELGEVDDIYERIHGALVFQEAEAVRKVTKSFNYPRCPLPPRFTHYRHSPQQALAHPNPSHQLTPMQSNHHQSPVHHGHSGALAASD